MSESEPIEPISQVSKRTSNSGNVGWGPPVILHETRNSRLLFRPYYIRHNTKPTELAGTLVSERRLKAPLEDEFDEEKSIYLDGPTTRELYRAIQERQVVALEPDDGNYLVIKTSEGTVDFDRHRPVDVARILMKVLTLPEMNSPTLNIDLDDDLVDRFRTALHVKEMTDGVQKLRELLDSGENLEGKYQAWCTEHSWVFGNAHVFTDLRTISIGDQLDILLKDIASGYQDLVELKRPNMLVLRWDDEHRNYYFSVETAKAIGQCHRYLDILHDQAAHGLLDHSEIVAYYPKATIVIGRSIDWGDEPNKALHGLNQRLHNISVLTYDHLLARAERMLAIFEGKRDTSPRRQRRTRT